MVTLKGKNFLVHRIVAETFLSNTNKLLEVNHIDGNKKNNSVINLEWVTHSQNVKHAYTTGLNKITELKRKKCSINGKKASLSNKIKITQYDLDGNKIKTWSSAKEVKNILGFDESCIRKCCNGNRKQAYNYIWKNAI